jgi:hypothetical protein
MAKSERSPQFGQRAVELQGLADRYSSLVANPVVPQTATTGKRAHCQEMVKEMVEGRSRAVRQKASAHVNSVSAQALTSSAFASALAPTSPILFSSRLQTAKQAKTRSQRCDRATVDGLLSEKRARF